MITELPPGAHQRDVRIDWRHGTYTHTISGDRRTLKIRRAPGPIAHAYQTEAGNEEDWCIYLENGGQLGITKEQHEIINREQQKRSQGGRGCWEDWQDQQE